MTPVTPDEQATTLDRAARLVGLSYELLLDVGCARIEAGGTLQDSALATVLDLLSQIRVRFCDPSALLSQPSPPLSTGADAAGRGR